MTEQRKGCSEHSTCAAASEAGKNPQYESNIPKTRRYRVWNAKHQPMAGKRRERTEETRLTEATIATASLSPHGEERRELRLKPRGRDLCARWFPSSFETRCKASLLRMRVGVHHNVCKTNLVSARQRAWLSVIERALALPWLAASATLPSPLPPRPLPPKAHARLDNASRRGLFSSHSIFFFCPATASAPRSWARSKSSSTG